MHVANVKGFGGMERGPERIVKIERPATAAAARGATGEAGADRATISADGRERLSTLDALAERLAEPDPERAAVVARARVKLHSGELDSMEAVQGAARAMLSGEG